MEALFAFSLIEKFFNVTLKISCPSSDSDAGHFSEDSKMDYDVEMEDDGHDLSPSRSYSLKR